MSNWITALTFLAAIGLGACASSPYAVPQGDDSTELAKKTQNPVADLISLPLQNNTDFDVGPANDTRNTLNVQPVLPFEWSEDWNLITRTIIPVIDQPLPGSGSEFGLGDSVFTAFFSPREDSSFIWGVGPVALLPTSTDDALGVGEWGGGVSAVALKMSGPWVVGALVNNVWSFESSAVNLLTLQPFVNYNLADGWYLVSAPIVTSDWEADSGERWTIPLGAGVGRVFTVGAQPINAGLQFYDYVEAPTFGPEWQVRLQVSFLFPK